MATTTQTSPRGTERTRRRAAQTKHAEQALAEGVALTSPRTPAKAAAIKAAKETQLAKFGPTAKTRRETVQRTNKQRADAEAATLAAAPTPERPKLIPGTQPSLLQLRRMAKANDAEERDTITEAAKAAGVAVRNTLRGLPSRDRYSRSRRIERHNAAAAAAAAQQTS